MATPDLITTVDLGLRYEDGTPLYQFVYASQLYGTLFGIYGQFDGHPTADNNAFHLEYIRLYLLNYHGILNIRFKHPLLRRDELDDTLFSFDVQGAGPEKDATIDLRDSPIIVERGDRYLITFNRILYPVNDFRGINPEPGELTAPSIDYSEYDIFDTEFFYRNGIDRYENLRRPGMIGCPPDKEEKQKKVLGKDIVIPSGRCHQSFVSLIYH